MKKSSWDSNICWLRLAQVIQTKPQLTGYSFHSAGTRASNTWIQSSVNKLKVDIRRDFLLLKAVRLWNNLPMGIVGGEKSKLFWGWTGDIQSFLSLIRQENFCVAKLCFLSWLNKPVKELKRQHKSHTDPEQSSISWTHWLQPVDSDSEGLHKYPCELCGRSQMETLLWPNLQLWC